MVRQRVRIRFRKQGDLRLIGHRDLVRTMERLFRRARLPLAMSEGFHPKPRMSFPSALAVGIAGSNEVMELELTRSAAVDELLDRMARHAPPGLSLDSIEPMPPGVRKAQVRSITYHVPIPPQDRDDVARRIAQLLAAPSCAIQRSGRPEPIELHRFLEALRLCGDTLEMRFRSAREATPGPRDVLAVLGLADVEREGGVITRTQVELQT